MNNSVCHTEAWSRTSVCLLFPAVSGRTRLRATAVCLTASAWVPATACSFALIVQTHFVSVAVLWPGREAARRDGVWCGGGQLKAKNGGLKRKREDYYLLTRSTAVTLGRLDAPTYAYTCRFMQQFEFNDKESSV
ncbi:hypothetical protein RRG08_054224 [Elysia crispata]|uniref:Uncharacterized protein n=1 Tax=Elysia crispata TaxID=231223 RepID=A0AAE0YDF6_9GAST|nr:hypothetical protein RRG08_054224 [Elysia crispata]